MNEPRTSESGEDLVLAKRVAEEVLATPDMVIERELEALARSFLEVLDLASGNDELCDALFWISEYPNRVLPHEGQEEHAVELAEHARDALNLHDEKVAASRA